MSAANDKKVDAALAAALAENEKLKKTLARLQRVERDLIGEGKLQGDVKAPAADAKAKGSAPPAAKPAVVVDQAAIKAAFDAFDLDKSGFIEPLELALLSAQLGQVLDDEELDAAVKAIDTSGDGKIEFAEFFKWWTGAAGQVSNKSGMKVALLRARMTALQGKQAFENVAKAASEKKAAAPVKKAGQRQHVVGLNLGDFDKAAMSLNAKLRADVPIDAKIAAAPKDYSVVVAVDLKTNGRPDFVEYINTLVSSFTKIREVKEYITVVASPTAAGVRVSIGVRAPIPDVDEVLGQIGLDLKPLHNAIDVSLSVAHNVDDVFTPEKKLSVFDLIQLRTNITLNLDTALLLQAYGFAQEGPRDAREMSALLPFLTVVDSKTKVSLGSVKEVAETYYDYVVKSKGENHYKARDLKAFLDPITNVIAKEMKSEVERDRRGEIFAVLAGVKALVYTLNRDLIEVTGVSWSLRNGQGVSVDLAGVAVLAHVIKAVEWFSKFVDANAPKEDNDAYRRRRGRW